MLSLGDIAEFVHRRMCWLGRHDYENESTDLPDGGIRVAAHCRWCGVAHGHSVVFHDCRFADTSPADTVVFR